jgi:hypothetical protein
VFVFNYPLTGCTTQGHAIKINLFALQGSDAEQAVVLRLKDIIVETPIPKAKRGGIGKLNNPAQRRV